MKILMIWTGNSNEELGGVGKYRVVAPARWLKKLGYDIDVVSGFEISKKFREGVYENELMDVYMSIMRKYDIIWMKHTDNEAAISALFAFKEKFGKKIIWDFDDDLFSVRESQPAWEQYKPGSRKRAVIGACLSLCDAITVSTEPLKESLSQLLKEVYKVDKQIFVCPNFLELDDWRKVTYKPKQDPVIGYYGSLTHNDDLESIVPAIEEVLTKYPKVRFNILGAVHPEDMLKLFKNTKNREILKRIGYGGGTPGWNGFPKLLLKQNWDISVAPLIDDKFNRAKSHIKWMESSMKGIPTVVSNVYPYVQPFNGTPVVIDGVTGFVCGDWVATLSKLIEDKELRKEVGENARLAVRTNWSAEKIIPYWQKAIETLCEQWS